MFIFSFWCETYDFTLDFTNTLMPFSRNIFITFVHICLKDVILKGV